MHLQSDPPLFSLASLACFLSRACIFFGRVAVFVSGKSFKSSRFFVEGVVLLTVLAAVVVDVGVVVVYVLAGVAKEVNLVGAVAYVFSSRSVSSHEIPVDSESSYEIPLDSESSSYSSGSTGLS